MTVVLDSVDLDDGAASRASGKSFGFSSLKADCTSGGGINGMVFAQCGTSAGDHFGAALADDNIAALNGLAAKQFYA